MNDVDVENYFGPPVTKSEVDTCCDVSAPKGFCDCELVSDRKGPEVSDIICGSFWFPPGKTEMPVLKGFLSAGSITEFD